MFPRRRLLLMGNIGYTAVAFFALQGDGFNTVRRRNLETSYSLLESILSLTHLRVFYLTNSTLIILTVKQTTNNFFSGIFY